MRHNFHERHFHPGVIKTSEDDRAHKKTIKTMAKSKEQTFKTSAPLNNFFTRRQSQVSPRLFQHIQSEKSTFRGKVYSAYDKM